MDCETIKKLKKEGMGWYRIGMLYGVSSVTAKKWFERLCTDGEGS